MRTCSPVASRHSAASRLLSVACVWLVWLPSLSAQCVQWEGNTTQVGLNGSGFTTCRWDPDGAGAQIPQLVIGGSFSPSGVAPINKVARYSGADLQSVGPGVSFEVWAVTSWDPDGPGPQQPQIVVGGQSGLQKFNGLTWEALGVVGSPYVYALTTWDPDGDGPLGELLIAGGTFPWAATQDARRVAAWDGSAWRALGTGVGSPGDQVNALTTWDPDGDGPLPRQLVAAGRFTVAGTTTVNNIAVWNGATWTALGSGLGNASTSVDHLTAWDPDGDGPLPERLVADGSFENSGVAPMQNIAMWNGSQWTSLYAGFGARPTGVSTWDPDGSGPVTPRLLAGPTYPAGPDGLRMKAWDGTSWQTLGGVFSAPVISTGQWDPDGDGPAPSQPIAVGSFQEVEGARLRGVARFDGTRWQPVGTGTNDPMLAVAPWDPDGPGPLPERMLGAGPLTAAGGSIVNHFAVWDGLSWTGADGGVNANAQAVTSWDPDGPGPANPLAIVGGVFTAAGAVSAPGVAAWNGSSWSPLGAGLPNGVAALTSWDPDGAAPQLPLLVAGEQPMWNETLSRTESRIMVWNGSVWAAAGQPVVGYITQVTRGDVDQNGVDELYACGQRSLGGGSYVGFVQRFDGAAWSDVGGTFPGGSVNAAVVWDPDGTGAKPPLLVAGGEFYWLPGATGRVDYVAKWDGLSWTQLGNGFNNRVNWLTTWDVDGAGPQPPQLVAIGPFSSSGTTSCPSIARFEVSGDVGWSSVIASGGPSSFQVAPLRSTLSGRDELVFGMQGSRLVATGSTPIVVQSPPETWGCPGGSVTLSAAAVSGGAMTTRWQINVAPNSWAELSNGAVTLGGQPLATASGVSTQTLTLSNLSSTNAAPRLRMRATNACGTVFSSVVRLRVNPADIGVTGGAVGHDGVLNNNDFVAFIDAFFTASPEADLGATGGARGGDGRFDNNDFVAFIDAFFSACGG